MTGFLQKFEPKSDRTTTKKVDHDLRIVNQALVPHPKRSIEGTKDGYIGLYPTYNSVKKLIELKNSQKYHHAFMELSRKRKAPAKHV